MAIINLNPMPSKAIGKNVYLQTKGPYRPSKDFKPKRHPNISRKGESKETKDFILKVEEGGMHPNIYDGYYTKQCFKVPKATLTIQ
jgi:hypothetical protein